MFIYATATRRTIMRFVEIFVISFIIGGLNYLITAPEFLNLFPVVLVPFVTAGIAGLLKALRERNETKI